MLKVQLFPNPAISSESRMNNCCDNRRIRKLIANAGGCLCRLAPSRIKQREITNAGGCLCRYKFSRVSVLASEDASV